MKHSARKSAAAAAGIVLAALTTLTMGTGPASANDVTHTYKEATVEYMDYGDIISVEDDLADGYSVHVYVADLDHPWLDWPDACHVGGAGNDAWCNKDFPDNDELQFVVWLRKDGDDRFLDEFDVYA